MTISQSTSGCGHAPSAMAPLGRMIRPLLRWRKRRRAAADLARLAQVGDYLLRDVGLDPVLVRQNPEAARDRIARRP